jgi:hypothetical protein
VTGRRGALLAVLFGVPAVVAPAPTRADTAAVAAALAPLGSIVDDEIRAGRIRARSSSSGMRGPSSTGVPSGTARSSPFGAR